MKRLGMGLVGPGFIAAHHIDAVRRLGDVDVVAIAGSSVESAKRKAAEYKVGRSYGDYRELIADPDIHVVHNTTPNHMHFPVTMAAIEAGKHVVSDKPLAMNSDESRRLRDAAIAAKVAHAVTFNYRGNPLVQHARTMVADGSIGNLTFIQGFYLQDWLTDPNVYSWRSDPAKGGGTSALGDIGSHWCDLAEHVSGKKIASVLADITTVVKTRYATEGSSEAFSKTTSGDRKAIPMTSEDLATVLLRFEDGTKGTFSAAQTLPGHKNDLQFEISGLKHSLKWRQEEQNELWVGSHEGPNCIVGKDPALVAGEALRYTHLPAGHQESWADAFMNIVSDAYTWVRAGAGIQDKPSPLPTFDDGYRSNCIVDAILASHAAGNTWQKVQYFPPSF
ncbi:oxidoreductase domain protein [Terriglobus saanensis SP1PR4]|uniref:Oxidoreductase domain protein n=2 Tax=Terriglobus saanensis TaxID=870903 RepID=E8V0K5_TERSS|nr:oxidoreductase domain protein [Terriglobus saanensis SP1PR4]